MICERGKYDFAVVIKWVMCVRTHFNDYKSTIK